ncbi:GNAT family N-acetyltransferase [Actinomycetota bacterium Odt1-20B]
MSDDVEVRPITEDELSEWLRACNAGFMRPLARVSDETVAYRRKSVDPARTQGAFDPVTGRCVATFRSFAQEITAVGGAPVPADAIANVTVSPTHRRRGLLGRMMAADLAAAKERGDVVATLIPSEYGIYGRFGFGPATWITKWSVDVPRSGLDRRVPAPREGGRVDLVDGAQVRDLGPEFHDRFRTGRHGAINRDEHWWQRNTGQQVTAEYPWTEPFYALYRTPAGVVEGLVAYEVETRHNDAKQPAGAATVLALTASTPAAERALWHHVLSLDWVTTVHSGERAPDDLLPDLLPDPRAAAVTTRADWLWLRILDVVRALEARTYRGSGSLVLEVRDRAGYAAGRFRLDAGAGGARCVPTGERAQLSLDVAELSSLWLGGASAERFAALGRVAAEEEGADRVADALFGVSRSPWCPDIF